MSPYKVVVLKLTTSESPAGRHTDQLAFPQVLSRGCAAGGGSHVREPLLQGKREARGASVCKCKKSGN